jgi:O-antigen/teichoic acid export membrane protein
MLNGKSNFKIFLILFAFVIPFLAEFNYSLGILRGMKDMRMMAIANNIFVWLPRLAMLGIIFFLKANIQSIVVPYYVSYIIGLTVVWLYIKRKIITFDEIGSFNENDQASRLRNQLIAYSLPLAFSGISSVIRQRFDVIFIGLFLDASQVGLYSVALSLAMLMTVLLVAINRITLPVVTGLFSKNYDSEIKHIYRLLAKWSLMITLPIFFLMLLFPERIINFTFGDRYAEAANALRLLSVGFFINAISGSFGEYLQTYGKTKSILIISVTGAAVNFILMVLLIPKFGIIGAAIACTLTLSYISLIGNAILYKYKRILPISKHYFYTLFIGIVFFLGSYFIHTYLFPNLNTYNFFIFILLVILIYLVLLYFFAADEFDKNLIGIAKFNKINTLLKEY